MAKSQDPTEDLRTIGRGLRNLVGRGADALRERFGARPNVQLTQLVKERYDALVQTREYTEVQAKEMVLGLVKASLEEAIAAEKTAQEEGVAAPASEEKTGEGGTGEGTS